MKLESSEIENGRFKIVVRPSRLQQAGETPTPQTVWKCALAPVIILLLVSSSFLRADDDWPQWRGRNRDGKATTDAAPVSWSETKNVVWKAAVPGRGQSDPTVVGRHVFLTTADEKTQIQSLLCFDRQSGKPLWKTDVHKGGFEKEKHGKCSDAVSTVACDGQRAFAVFLNQKAIWVTAFDLKGKKIWQKQVSKFNSKFGYGASPLLYKSYLIVASDNQGGGTLTALDRKSGNVVWNTQRQAAPTYSSPAVATVAGKEQLLISGADRITSYDPGTGKLAWSCQGASIQTVNTMAFAGDLVYASGGFPTKETFCIRADGSAMESAMKIYRAE